MKYWYSSALAAVLIIITGCGLTGTNKKRTAVEEQAIRELPVPNEFELEPPKSRGSRDALSFRTGLLTYRGPAALDEVSRFYKTSLILEGWTALESSPVEFPSHEPLDRSQTLYYQKDRAIVQINIGESTKSRPYAPESIVIVQIQNQ